MLKLDIEASEAPSWSGAVKFCDTRFRVVKGMPSGNAEA